jgi:sulfite exporter TauE/SafE
MQGGRVTSYVLLGLLFGTLGAGITVRMDFSDLHLALQWAAGSAIVWLGLSTAGLVPSLAAADRIGAPLVRVLAAARNGLSRSGTETAMLGGLLWGITPCAMVYAALFNSVLTGNASGGMLLMFAFGLGTVPAVVLSTMALAGARSRFGRPDRYVAGWLMVGAGILALLLTVPGSPLCISAA